MLNIAEHFIFLVLFKLTLITKSNENSESEFIWCMHFGNMTRIYSFYFCRDCQLQFSSSSMVDSGGMRNCKNCNKRINPYSVVNLNCQFTKFKNRKSSVLF